jgi:hypothetical protein
MSLIHVEYSDVIPASAEKVYAILRDFEVGHPAILPKPYFHKVEIEQGGQGEGTIYHLEMNVFGTKTKNRMHVSEPKPGKVLMERDPEVGLTTIMQVDPLNGGQQSRVTIKTDFTASPGFRGFIEKLMNPPITRHIYKKELQNLADYVRN